MSCIETVAPGKAEGPVADMYEADRAAFGYLPNLTRAFSARPEVYLAWKQLNGAVKAGMDLRRYELATVAAARRLRSSYCTLAHGEILASRSPRRCGASSARSWTAPAPLPMPGSPRSTRRCVTR
jgi:alkylhydroperoxidase family enzyme